MGLQADADNKAVVQGSDVLMLAVKPQHFATVLNETKSVRDPKSLVISILAGTSTSGTEIQKES